MPAWRIFNDASKQSMLQNATNRIADKGMIDRDQMADSSEARKTTESRSMFIQYY